MLGSIAQLVQSVCLTSRGSGVRLPLLPLRRHFGISEVPFFCSSVTDFIRFIATCALKRFLRTSLSKFTMSCANRAFLLTRESSRVVESKLHPSHDGLSTFHGHLVPNKRFKQYKMPFTTHLVPSKTFSQNKWFLQIPSVMFKTFSTHIASKKCHVVSKPVLFTHEG